MAYGYKRKRRYTRKRYGRRRRPISVPHRRYASSSGARARHRARVLGGGTSKPRYVAKRTYDQMTPDGPVQGRVIVRRGPRSAPGKGRGDAKAKLFWDHTKEYATTLGKRVADYAARSFHEAVTHPELIESARKVARTAGPMIEEIAGAADGALMLTL